MRILARAMAVALLLLLLAWSPLSAQPPADPPAPAAPPSPAKPAAKPAAVPSPAQPTVCETKGREAIKKAREKGFLFSAELTSGTGKCHFSDAHFIASASTDGTGVSCKLSFFGGRRLKAPWKITDVGFHGADVVELLSPIASDQAYTLPISVRVSADAGKSVVVSITMMALTGGTCDAWHNAF